MKKVLVILVLIVLCALTLVKINSEKIKLATEISEVRKDGEELLKTKAKLEYEISRLKSPDQIVKNVVMMNLDLVGSNQEEPTSMSNRMPLRILGEREEVLRSSIVR